MPCRQWRVTTYGNDDDDDDDNDDNDVMMMMMMMMMMMTLTMKIIMMMMVMILMMKMMIMMMMMMMMMIMMIKMKTMMMIVPSTAWTILRIDNISVDILNGRIDKETHLTYVTLRRCDLTFDVTGTKTGIQYVIDYQLTKSAFMTSLLTYAYDLYGNKRTCLQRNRDITKFLHWR